MLIISPLLGSTRDVSPRLGHKLDSYFDPATQRQEFLSGASYKAFSSSFRLTAGPNVMVLV